MFVGCGWNVCENQYLSREPERYCLPDGANLVLVCVYPAVLNLDLNLVQLRYTTYYVKRNNNSPRITGHKKVLFRFTQYVVSRCSTAIGQ